LLKKKRNDLVFGYVVDEIGLSIRQSYYERYFITKEEKVQDL